MYKDVHPCPPNRGYEKLVQQLLHVLDRLQTDLIFCTELIEKLLKHQCIHSKQSGCFKNRTYVICDEIPVFSIVLSTSGGALKVSNHSDNAAIKVNSLFRVTG
jgi:hypothetical protein